jgi:hypothetical protein
MSKACNFRNPKKILEQIDKELGLLKVRKIWFYNYISQRTWKKVK